MKRAPVRIAAATVPTLFLFGLAAAMPVYADANPNNHGHHYGQLKHPKQVPTPNPVPTPTPHPVSTPAPTPAAQSSGIANAIAALPAASPAPSSKANPQARTAPIAPAPRDLFWWLVLLILPALVAAGLIAFRGLLVGAVRGAAARPAVPAKTASVPSPQPSS